MTKPAAILQEDIVRALRAAKKMGAPVVRITSGKVTIEIPLTDKHIGLMSNGHLPASDANEEQGKIKLRW